MEGPTLNFKIAICDDYEIYLDEIEKTLRKYDWKDNTIIIYKYQSGSTLLCELENKMVFDIIFLDIDLREDNLGTDVGRSIKAMCPNTLLIYISAYNRFYMDLANAEPFHFLRKPVTLDILAPVLNRALDRLYLIKNNFFYNYKSRGTTQKINLAETKYFYSERRKIISFSKDSIVDFYGKLDILENDVSKIYPYFLRPNNRYLVNYKYIEKLNNQFLTIGNNEITISKAYKDNFKKKLFYFVNNRL